MNVQAYVIDLSLAAIAIGLYLHVSHCSGKYLTRAEFDEYVAAVRPGGEPVAKRQWEADGAAGRDVALHTADCDNADAALRGRPDLRDGDGARADVHDADAFHGNGDANPVRMIPDRREDADVGLSPSCAPEVTHERVGEVREGDKRPGGGNG